MKNNLITFTLLCFCAIVWAQPPFVCGGEIYLSLYKIGAITSLNEVEIVGSNSATFTPVGPDIPYRINSIGYRVTDNYIYGIHAFNKRFYRIDATGTATELAQIDLTNNNNYVAGDVTPDGNYLVVIGKVMNNPANELVLIDLNSTTYETTKIPLVEFGTGLPNSTVNIADIAFSPATGVCYAYDSANKRLVTIDITTGEINSNLYPTTSAAGIGALFFDPLGQLWAYGRYSSSADLEDLIAIDLETGETAYVTSGPSTNGIDGCSCPYTVDLGKVILPDTIQQCEPFEIIYPISNFSGIVQSGIHFSDTLPAEFIIKEIVNNPFGGTEIGVGTNQLNINDLTLPIGIDSLIIKVNGPSDLEGYFSGYAFVSGLPDYLGVVISSDNPTTFQTDDETGITIVSFNCDCEVKMPNAFTPDNDEMNDHFFPIINEDCEFTSFEFTIFNRWGELVYETDSVTPVDMGWDGQMNGKVQAVDTYVWVVKYQYTEDDSVIVERGDVTLLR